MAMMPPHNTENYALGRGLLYAAEFSGGAPGEYVEVGNCPRFELELTEEKLDHFDSRSGLKNKDRQVVIQTGYTVNFDLDEIAAENLQKFLKASRDGKRLMVNQNPDAEYALRFSARNPVGPRQRWEFWRVKLAPAGALGLIGENWETLSFVGEGLADTVNHPESPQIDVLMTTTTTTTSSTTSTTA